MLSLDGASGYVSFEQPIILSSEFSIEAWYLMAGEGGGSEQQNFIFAQRDNQSGCDHSAISLAARTLPALPSKSFALRSDASCYDYAISPAEQFVEWHHIAAVKDQSTMKLYIDGQLVDNTEIQQTGSYTSNITTTELGRHRYNNENAGFYNGSIDNVGIWNRALTAAEVNSRMQSGLSGNESGLVAFLNFDDSTSTDLTGNGNNGTMVGGATTLQCDINLSENTVWGDLNQDGLLNISDVIVLIDMILF